jgi:uncharacterized membrane protein YdbT with pleckstrin-like domain
MSYVESNLLPGEEIIYQARLHPIIYLPAILFGLVGVILMLSSLALSGDRESMGFTVLAGVIFLILGLAAAGGAYVNMITSEFAVTNRRVIIKVGWLSRRSFEIVLPKVEGIGVDQNILGRMLDFGTIVVRGTGGSREAFANIAMPLEFRRQVQRLVPE